MRRRTLILTAIVASCLPASSGCSDVAGVPKTQVFVLVDLSETWKNDLQAVRDQEVLEEAGFGIALATDNLEAPIAVQVRAIGVRTLEREPICDVVYQPRLVPIRSGASYEINRRSHLDRYLGVDCPAEIMRQPPEPLTEITAAIASVANQPSANASRRDIIIVSDFLEETSTPVSLDIDLTGFRVLLLYRPITEDFARPAGMRARVADWEAAIRQQGGQVTIMPDTAVKRRMIASYLLGEFQRGRN